MVQLSAAETHVIVLTLSWVAGFLPLLFGKRMTWVQCVGLALVLHPFIRMLVGLLRTAPLLFTPTVLEPASPIALWMSVERQIWSNLALPLIGLFLLHNGYRDAAAGSSYARARFADALAEHGVAPRHSIRRDVQRGLALFVFIAAAYLVAYLVAHALAPVVQAGSDESLYWRNITIPLIIMLSLSAGFAEEFLFRGLLLTHLARRMPWVAAALLQAVFFGLIHAGYGTWTHVLGPFVFGLGMAWVARHLGVLVAALLHAQVNIVFFTVDVAPTYLSVHGGLGVVALAGVSVALLAACVWSLRETRADAVRILWGDVLRMLGLRKKEPAAPALDEPRAG